MSIRFLNKGGSAVSVKPNIFMQETEPETKEGIWLQKEGSFEKILIKDSSEYQIKLAEVITSSYPYGVRGGGLTAIGTDIYSFGGGGLDSGLAFKYDTLTNTYTKLKDTPITIQYGGATAINNNIFIFYSTNAYKYDISTTNYTKLTDVPFDFYNGGYTFIDKEIYLFGGSKATTSAYKYNTATNTYTKLTDIPFELGTGGRAIAVGSDIYLFGGKTNPSIMYKYNTITDTYTQLTNIPYEFYGGDLIAVDNYIYIFGGINSTLSTYKYNTSTNMFTEEEAIPYDFQYGRAILLENNKVYLFGGLNNEYKTVSGSLLINAGEINIDKAVVILNGDKYSTQMISDEKINGRLLSNFDNVLHYTTENGLDDTIPTYYGNGTEWIKFKN